MSSWPSLIEFGQFSLVAFGSILFIVNPVAAIAIQFVLDGLMASALFASRSTP